MPNAINVTDKTEPRMHESLCNVDIVFSMRRRREWTTRRGSLESQSSRTDRRHNGNDMQLRQNKVSLQLRTQKNPAVVSDFTIEESPRSTSTSTHKQSPYRYKSSKLERGLQELKTLMLLDDERGRTELYKSPRLIAGVQPNNSIEGRVVEIDIKEIEFTEKASPFAKIKCRHLPDKELTQWHGQISPINKRGCNKSLQLYNEMPNIDLWGEDD